MYNALTPIEPVVTDVDPLFRNLIFAVLAVAVSM